jgi:hypothetical protein
MTLADIIPLVYWFRTRPKNLNGLASYFAIVLAFPVILLVYAGVSWLTLKFFFLTWIAHLSIHELGYFMNDFWSLKREQSKGFNLTKQLSHLPRIRVIILSIFTRLFLVVVIVSLVAQHLRNDLVVVILAVGLGIFVVHNIVLYPYRMFTYFLIYLSKYVLALPFTFFRIDPIVFGVSCLVPAIVHAILYGSSKELILKKLSRFAGNVSIFFTATAVGYGIASMPLLLRGQDTVLMGLLIIYCVFAALIYGSARFASCIYNSCKTTDTIYHVHTCYSSDCEVTPEEVHERAVALKAAVVHVTDHADTFDERKYLAFKNHLSKLSNTQCQLVPGLEYDIYGQHFLAIGLRQYINLSRGNSSQIEHLKLGCDRLIWAHPYFGVRRILLSPAYVFDLVQMMQNVDGLEWINLKEQHRANGWRSLLIAFCAVMLFGKKQFVIGLDAHTLSDWNNYVAFQDKFGARCSRAISYRKKLGLPASCFRRSLLLLFSYLSRLK